MKYTVTCMGKPLASFEFLSDALDYISRQPEPQYFKLLMSGENADHLRTA